MYSGTRNCADVISPDYILGDAQPTFLRREQWELVHSSKQVEYVPAYASLKWTGTLIYLKKTQTEIKSQSEIVE